MVDIGFDGLTIGERVDKAIKDSGYKTEDIAFELDISTGQVRKLIRGEHEFKTSYVEQIADYLHVDLEYLKTGRMLVDKSDNQMELIERIKNDVNSLEKLPPKDRLEHIAFMLEMTAEMLRKE